MELNNTNLTLFNHNVSSLYECCDSFIFNEICSLVKDLKLYDFGDNIIDYGIDLSAALTSLLIDLPYIKLSIQVRGDDYDAGFLFINIPTECFFEKNQNWNNFKVILKNTNVKKGSSCYNLNLFLIKKDLGTIIVDNI